MLEKFAKEYFETFVSLVLIQKRFLDTYAFKTFEKEILWNLYEQKIH